MEKTLALQIRVDLNDSKPPIWRRILVPADTPLDQLHLILQGAFGWTDSHLHGFRKGHRRFLSNPEPYESAEEESVVMVGALLNKEKATLIYDYDFGDDWQHTLRLEKKVQLTEEQLRELPQLLGGARACPPEDCGGAYGYQEFLKLLAAKDPETMEWAADLGGEGKWAAESFDREEHQAYMRDLVCGADTNSPLWTPLEEQLAWSKLDTFVSQPEWKLTWELANEAMEVISSTPILGAPSSADGIPGYAELMRDHVAFDLILEENDPVVPELIRTHPNLPEGAQQFLRTMFLEPFAPYVVERAYRDGFLGLFSLVEKEILDVEARPDCEDLKEGDLLLARVISNGECNVIRGQCLQSPFDAEEYAQMFSHLQMMCELVGGDPSDSRQLLKPAVPLLLAFWRTMMSFEAPKVLPLATYRNAAWEPGTSVFLGPKEFTEDCAAALNRSTDLCLFSESLWMYVDPDVDPNAVPPHGLPGFPIAWIMLVPGQLHLLAGSRKALKLCRDSFKKLGLPPMRHFKTRYGTDLNLPVAPLQ